jgi:hypothetical protein
MLRAPEAMAFVVRRQLKNPYIVPDQNWNLGRDDRRSHDDDQRNGRDTREKPDNEYSVDNFHSSPTKGPMSSGQGVRIDD